MKLKHSEYVICNTTPLLYLHQLGLLHIIPAICENILIPPAVVIELNAGKEQGVDVPDVAKILVDTGKEPSLCISEFTYMRSWRWRD